MCKQIIRFLMKIGDSYDNTQNTQGLQIMDLPLAKKKRRGRAEA